MGIHTNFYFCFNIYKGKHIAKKVRDGKAVIVPKFGIFTFTSPAVNLEVILKKCLFYFWIGSNKS